MREAFEKWFPAAGWGPIPDLAEGKLAWDAWQAACDYMEREQVQPLREALEGTLDYFRYSYPDEWDIDEWNTDDPCGPPEWWHYCQRIRRALAKLPKPAEREGEEG